MQPLNLFKMFFIFSVLFPVAFATIAIGDNEGKPVGGLEWKDGVLVPAPLRSDPGGSRKERETRDTGSTPPLTEQERENQRNVEIGSKYYNAGITYENTEDWAAAEREFREAGLRLGWNVEVCWHLAYVIEKQGKYGDAIHWYKSVIGSTFETVGNRDHLPKIANHIGVLFMKLGNYKEAKYYFEKALRFDHKYSLARDNLVDLKKIMLQTDPDVRKEEAIRLCKHGRTLLLENKDIEQIQQAEKAFREAIRLNPHDLIAYNNLGVALRMQYRDEEAAEAYRQALKIDPYHELARKNLEKTLVTMGNVLSVLGDYKKAEGANREATKINPNNSNAYINLGFALEKQGHDKEAEKAYQQAYKLNPHSELARNNLRNTYMRIGSSLLRQGCDQEAEKAYRQALKIDPHHKEVKEWLDAREQAKKERAARQAQERDSTAAYHRGLLLSRQGRNGEARAAYQEAVNIDPNFQPARDELKKFEKSWLGRLWEAGKGFFTTKEPPKSLVSQGGWEEFHFILNDSTQRYEPINAPIKNDENNRSAGEYHRVIEQFDLPKVVKEIAPKRYAVEYYRVEYYNNKTLEKISKKEYYKLNKNESEIKNIPIDEKECKKLKKEERGKDTFCNIFVIDVIRSMVGPEESIPLLKANKIEGWLNKKGKKKGWYRADVRVAYKKANEGHPTIAIWKNPELDPNTREELHGHVAMVRPGNPDDRGPAIAQAGSAVLDARHLKEGFNDKHFKRKIEFWYHE